MKKWKLFAVAIGLMMVLGTVDVHAATVDQDKTAERNQVFVGLPGSNVEVTKEEDGVFKLKLTGDAVQDIIIYSGEEVELDLNGYTLTNYTPSCEALKILEGGSLTIVDRSAEQDGLVTQRNDSTYGPITNYGTLVINGGNFKTDLGFYVVRNEGINLTINGGYFESDSNTSLIGNIKYNELSADVPTMTINGGTFTSTNSSTIKNYENTVVTITNGTFKSETAYALDNSGNAAVTGGTFTSVKNSAIRHQINSENSDYSSLQVKGATLNSGADQTDYAIYDVALGQDVTDKYQMTTDADGNITLSPISDVVSEETPVGTGSTSNPETSDAILLFVSLAFISLAGSVFAYKKLHN